MTRLRLLPRQAAGLLHHPLTMILYIPGLFFAISMGMMEPILPLYAADFDVPYALVGLVLARIVSAGLVKLLAKLGERFLELLAYLAALFTLPQRPKSVAQLAAKRLQLLP